MSLENDDPFGDIPAAGGPVPVPAPSPAVSEPNPFDAEPPAAPTAAVRAPAEGPAETVVPRGGPVANGRREAIPPAPPLPRWEDPANQDRGDALDVEVDYSDLAALNRDLLRLRVQMSRVRRAMRTAGREAVEAKLEYQRALRRALVQQTGGSAETRKAAAELMCEELEARVTTLEKVADEYNTLFRSVRDDIENAKVVAYNLRVLGNLI